MKKNLLVTGASGFIGSHLIKKLINKNYNIISLGTSNIDGVINISHQNYSFTKEDFLKNGIDRIDILIHAGAFTPKSSNEANNLSGSTTNIVNTQHLMCNLPNVVEKIVFLSTLDVYGNNENILDEESFVSPVSLYGWSKLYCEKWLTQWACENRRIINILRIGHIYGRGEQEYQKIIPLTIKRCLNGENLSLFTDGQEKRSFLHINDCVDAIIKSIDVDLDGIVNIVSDQAITVFELVELIKNKINKSLTITTGENTTGVRSLIFDNSKMIKFLHVPSVSFNDGISDEIDAFREL